MAVRLVLLLRASRTWQFDVDGEPSRRFLERLVAFLQRSAASSS